MMLCFKHISSEKFRTQVADDSLDDSIDLNNYLVQKPTSTFMLKVQGMSMRDAGILPDDILIVDRSEKPRHNKIWRL